MAPPPGSNWTALPDGGGGRAGITLDIFYTNLEGAAISRIYQAVRDGVDGLVMNPAGFLYAGYALKDCLKSIPLPYIEVRMTNIDKRENSSVTAAESDGMITGPRAAMYWALDAVAGVISDRRAARIEHRAHRNGAGGSAWSGARAWRQFC